MLELRDYQKATSDAVIRDLENHKKVCVVLPTGAGKTVCFIDITKRYLDANPGKSVLILSHMSILTEQTKARMNDWFPKIRVGILKYGVRPDYFDQVIIGTMQSSRKKERIEKIEDRLIHKIGLIIVDEAHFIYTDSYAKLLSYLPDAKLIGFTATPFRENKIMVNYFEKISYSLSLGELIERNYLVKPQLIEMTRDSDEPAEVMAFVVKTYQEKETGNKAIVFMRTIKEAETMRNVFVDSGIPCEAVTSKITGKVRDETINDFNNGTLNVLTTVDVLSIGFDSPPCEVIFQPFATKSVTKYIQRIGRGLRTFEGKRECRVYIYGPQPDIQNRTYLKLQNVALNQGGPPKEYDNFKDELDFNDLSSQPSRYEWTMEVVDAIRKMEALGMNTFANLLNFKKFPKQYTENIQTLLDKLPKKRIKIPHGNKSATEAQIKFLVHYLFDPDHVKDVSKNEAHMMIRTIIGPEQGPFKVTSGRYAGYHIAETPFAYRSHVSKNFPGSEIAKLNELWENRNDKKLA